MLAGAVITGRLALGTDALLAVTELAVAAALALDGRRQYAGRRAFRLGDVGTRVGRAGRRLDGDGGRGVGVDPLLTVAATVGPARRSSRAARMARRGSSSSSRWDGPPRGQPASGVDWYASKRQAPFSAAHTAENRLFSVLTAPAAWMDPATLPITTATPGRRTTFSEVCSRTR